MVCLLTLIFFSSHKVDFDDALKRNAFELQQDVAERERQSKVIGKKMEGVTSEMEEKVEEISRIVTEMNTCFGLLVPKPSDLFQDQGTTSTSSKNDNDSESDSDEDEADNQVDLREHGIMDPRTVISIQLPEKPQQIKVTEDNAAVVESLKDHYMELKNGYLPSVKKWAQVASKAGKSGVNLLLKLVICEFSRLKYLFLCRQLFLIQKDYGFEGTCGGGNEKI